MQLHPVKILDPTSFCEAALLLYCRDLHHVYDHDISWGMMWSCLVQYQMRLNRPIRTEFKEFWELAEQRWVHNVRIKDLFKLLSDTRRQLIAKGVVLRSEIPEIEERGMK
ncbi:uncharacterized protein BDV17DRAFT_27161 [Aspergillus undulatus]|uniref:uncharacterized protein n=1 Tax=Aspergillus undulatus TaxID=1810928 RepID=UPI003CCCFB64